MERRVGRINLENVRSTQNVSNYCIDDQKMAKDDGWARAFFEARQYL